MYLLNTYLFVPTDQKTKYRALSVTSSVLWLWLYQLKTIASVDGGYCGEKFAFLKLLIFKSNAKVSAIAAEAESALHRVNKFVN